MVGLSLAAALRHRSLKLVLIDERLPLRPLAKDPELRVSAINQASENLLRRLGIWQAVQAQRLCAYRQMQVWEQDSFARIDFDHQDLQQPHLGHIIENQVLINALWEELLAANNVELLAPASISRFELNSELAEVELADGRLLKARLLVGTDGAQSRIRQQAGLPVTFADYQHKALVATIETQLPHQHCARQVFTPQGPLAFLPLYQDNLCSIVWSQQTHRADELLAMDKQEFEKTLSATFDNQLGPCKLVSERQGFPLTMRFARQWLTDRLVLAGDAAHTIHPLAGQGANLGLMDVAALAERLQMLHERGEDIGLAANLRPYERWRKSEAVKLIAAMQLFKGLFDGQHPLKKLIRGLGVSAVDKLPLAKRQAMKLAAGLDGELPALARPILD